MTGSVDMTALLTARYERGARGPAAYDCIGVAVAVLSQLHGEGVKRGFPSTRLDDPCTVQDLDANLWESVPVETCEPGVVVLTESPDPETGAMRHHAWTFIDRYNCATATPDLGVRVMSRGAIRNPIIGCYRWRGGA